MPIFKGTIYIHNTGKTVRVIAENRGESPGVFTANILPDKRMAMTGDAFSQHDDMRFGHGNATPAGSDRAPGTFKYEYLVGDTYNGQAAHGLTQTKIDAGAWVRVGFRYRSWFALEIPPPGQVKVVPFEDMIAGSNAQAGEVNGAGIGWPTAPLDRSLRSGHGDDALRAIYEIVERDDSAHVVTGQTRIVPIADEANKNVLKGWEVWFENQGPQQPKPGQTTGFIGTVVLTNAYGQGAKNAGREGGLESMAVPSGGFAARQFIRYDGDYGVEKFGVRAMPGTHVRLGVRGHSTFATQLPSLKEGELAVSLTRFEKEAAKVTPEFFDDRALLEKLGEKKGRIDVYRGGARINEQLADTVYEGDEAYLKAEFKDPPGVKVSWASNLSHGAGPGWLVEMTNRLPEADDHGPVGFRGSFGLTTPLLQSDPAPRSEAFSFTPSARRTEWELPLGTQMGEVIAVPGSLLVIDTGALGWRGKIALPGGGASTESGRRDWKLRETDYFRGGLYPPLESAALAKSYPAPRIVVSAQPPSPEHPAGGWEVQIRNQLPVKDAEGELGFVATLRLGVQGKMNAKLLPPKRLERPGELKSWFIDAGSMAGDTPAEHGSVLMVGTRGLGWRAGIALPEAGVTIDSSKVPGIWKHHADQFTRANLTRAFTGNVKE